MNQIEDLLYGWGDWARADASIGYPSHSTISRFGTDAGQSGSGVKTAMISVHDKTDQAVARLSRRHPLEGEIVKLTYLHRMNASRVGSALKIGRGQVRERLKYSHGWLEVFLFPDTFADEN